MSKSNSVMKSIISLIIIAFVTLGCFMVLPEFQGNYDNKVHAEEEQKQYNYSLNEISLVLSDYVDAAMKPNSKNANGMPSGIKAFDEFFDGTDVNGENEGYGGPFYTGNAGAFISYRDDGWLSSLTTNASSNYRYSTFRKMITSSGDSGYNIDEQARIMKYMQYGYMLGQLGLDTTGDDSVMSQIGCTIVGLPILVAYALSLTVPVAFSIIITILQFLNPFRLFEPKLRGMSAFNDDGGAGTALFGSNFSMGDGPKASEELTWGLSTFIGDWYEFFYNIAWELMVPIFFVLLIISVLLFRKSWAENGKKKIKNYVIRILFLVAGIPICGSTYTAALNGMAEAASGDNAAATRMIASTFVDFESWVVNGRLSPAYGVHIQCDNEHSGDNEHKNVNLSPIALLNTRSSAYYINKAWSYGVNNLTGPSPFGASDDYDDMSSWNTDKSIGDFEYEYEYEDKVDEYGNVTGKTVKNVKLKATGGSSGGYRNVLNTMTLLYKYMNAESITASEYESDVKATLSYMGQSDTRYSGYISDLFEVSSDISFYYSKGAGDGKDPDDEDDRWKRVIGAHRFRDMDDFLCEDEPHGIKLEEPLIEYIESRIENSQREARYGVDMTPMPNIFANGALTYDFDKGQWKDAKLDIDGGYKNVTIPDDWLIENGMEDKTKRLTQQFGLSTMSMFNYLNTVFTSDGVTTYSSDLSASLFTRDTHRAVSLVGTGFQSVLYWVNCFTMLGSFVVIGYCYALSMIFGNIKRSARLIASVPGAMLGSVRSIARVVGYTVILILEVFGTMFAYFLVTELLMDLQGLVETPFIGALSNAFGDGGSTIMNPVTMNTSLSLAGSDMAGELTSIVLIMGTLLSTVVTGWFTIIALRWRKKIVRTLDEVAVAVIDRLFETKSGVNINNNSRLKEMAGKAAGAVATGAGLAMGNRAAGQALGALGSNSVEVGDSPLSSAGTGGVGGAGGAGGSVAMAGDGPDSPEFGDGDANAAMAAFGMSGDGVTNVSDDDNVSVSGSSETAGFMGDELQESARAEAAQGERVAGLDSVGDSISDMTGSDSSFADSITNGVDEAASGIGADIADGLKETLGEAVDGKAQDGTTPNAVASNNIAMAQPGQAQGQEKKQDGANSAVMDEKEDERAKELKAQKQKEALTNAVSGGAQAVEGAAQAYAGAETGDVQMLADGAQNMQQGLDKTQNAGTNFANAGKDAKAQAHAERQQAEAQQQQVTNNNNTDNSTSSTNIENGGGIASSIENSTSDIDSINNAGNNTTTNGDKNVMAAGGINNSVTSNSDKHGDNITKNGNNTGVLNSSNVSNNKGGDLNTATSTNVNAGNANIQGGNTYNNNNTSVSDNSVSSRNTTTSVNNSSGGQSGSKQLAAKGGSGFTPSSGGSNGGGGTTFNQTNINAMAMSVSQTNNQTTNVDNSRRTTSDSGKRASGSSTNFTNINVNSTSNSTKILNSNTHNSGGFIGDNGSSSGTSGPKQIKPKNSGGSSDSE